MSSLRFLPLLLGASLILFPAHGGRADDDSRDQGQGRYEALDTQDRISSIDQAFAATFMKYPGLRAERATLRAAQEEYPQAVANWLPSLSANAALNAANVSGDEVDSDLDGAATKELGFSLSQPLFNGGRNFAEMREALNNIYAAQATLDRREQSIFLDVVRAYMNVIRDRKALYLQQQNEEILRSRLENSRSLFEAGELTRADVNQSRARLSNAQSDRIDAEVDLNASIASFFNLTGFTPAENLTRPAAAADIPQSLEDIQDIALNANPEIIEARFDYLSSKASIDAETGDLGPQVSLGASYRNQIDPGPGTDDRRTEQNIGLRVNVPFFQGGAKRSEIREAKIFANQRRLEMLQTMRDITEQVSDSWRSYQSAFRKIDLRQTQVDAAREAREAVRREVQAGERLYIDLLDSDQDVLDAELNFILAQRDYVIEAYRLRALMGRLNSAYMQLDPEGKVYNASQQTKGHKTMRGFLSTDVYEDVEDSETRAEALFGRIRDRDGQGVISRDIPESQSQKQAKIRANDPMAEAILAQNAFAAENALAAQRIKSSKRVDIRTASFIPPRPVRKPAYGAAPVASPAKDNIPAERFDEEIFDDDFDAEIEEFFKTLPGATPPPQDIDYDSPVPPNDPRGPQKEAMLNDIRPNSGNTTQATYNPGNTLVRVSPLLKKASVKSEQALASRMSVRTVSPSAFFIKSGPFLSYDEAAALIERHKFLANATLISDFKDGREIFEVRSGPYQTEKLANAFISTMPKNGQYGHIIGKY